MARVVSAEELSLKMREHFSLSRDAWACDVKSVTGPGRSGAVASAIASHMLGVPFVPYGQNIPSKLYPVLVIDTAASTGATLRKAVKKYEVNGAVFGLAVFKEPPRVKF